MNSIAVMLGRKQYAAAFVCHEGRQSGQLDGWRTIRMRDHEYALCRILCADHRMLRLGMQPDRPGEFAVVHPLAKHELVLVLDVRVDEVTQQAAFNSVIRLGGIVDRSIRHPAANQPMGVIASARMTLPRNWLSPRVDPAHVRADGATDSPRVACAVCVDV